MVHIDSVTAQNSSPNVDRRTRNSRPQLTIRRERNSTYGRCHDGGRNECPAADQRGGSAAAGGGRLGGRRSRGGGPPPCRWPVRVPRRRVLLRRDRPSSAGRRAGQPDAGAVPGGRLVRVGGRPSVGFSGLTGIGIGCVRVARRPDSPGIRRDAAASGGGGRGGCP